MHHDSGSRIHSSRRGIATIWVVVAIPVITTLMIVVLDVANVWLAKSELKNAMDSGALSGVKTWGEGSSTLAARQAADRAASTNRVLGTSLTLSTVEGGCANNNLSSTGEIVLGSYVDAGTTFAFNCNVVPNCGINVPFAVRTRKTVAVTSLASSLFGFPVGPFQVTAESYARYSCPGGPPQLFRVDTYGCVCP